jgi:hypothetical protein
LCSENDHDVKPIFDQSQFEYHGEGSTNAGVYGLVLAKMEKYDQVEKYIQRELNASSSDQHIDKTNGTVLYLVRKVPCTETVSNRLPM